MLTIQLALGPLIVKWEIQGTHAWYSKAPKQNKDSDGEITSLRVYGLFSFLS